MQISLAGLDLAWMRVAVVGRAALQTLTMHTSLASHPDLGQQLSSSLPAAPTNGSPIRSSLAPGRLADEHQLGIRVARAKNDIGARVVQRAADAPRSFGIDLLELIAALGGGGHGL